jgi:glutamate-ammonia-ligase adenylyltransferase
MSDGRLYEVDMRLRPSGRQGPVATSLQAFQDYQTNEAWTWEHLALTRARAVAGNVDLGDDVATFRAQLLQDKGQGASILKDVSEMRARIAEAKPQKGHWDAKIGAGRLQDCELFAQTAALRAGSAVHSRGAQIAAGVAKGWLNAAEAADITAAAGLFWQLQAAAGLLSDGVLEPEALGEGGRRLILRETGCTTEAELVEKIQAAAMCANKVITAKLNEA